MIVKGNGVLTTRYIQTALAAKHNDEDKIIPEIFNRIR
jgi:hypothetical protein